MKKILLAAVAGMLLVACNNVKQFEAPIEALSTQWDAATTQVTDFATLIAQEVSNAETMGSGMMPAGGAITTTADAANAGAIELFSLFQQEKGQLDAINSEVGGFVQTWSENADKLAGLKEGLASAKLGTETQATIDGLNAVVGEAGTKVADWTERLNAAKTKLADIAKQFAAQSGGVDAMTK